MTRKRDMVKDFAKENLNLDVSKLYSIKELKNLNKMRKIVRPVMNEVVRLYNLHKESDLNNFAIIMEYLKGINYILGLYINTLDENKKSQEKYKAIIDFRQMIEKHMNLIDSSLSGIPELMKLFNF